MLRRSEVLFGLYRYDPLDRLIGQSLPGLLEGKRFYLKSRLATEVEGDCSYSLFQNGEKLLAQQRHQGGMLDLTLLATDQQRSVLNTIDAIFPQVIAYSPYGYRTAASGMSSLLGFNGEHQDLLTGNYMLGNGNRSFNPVLMHFTSPDIMSPFGMGGVNSYAYCQGDPINNSDPTGNVILPSRVRAMISGWVQKAKANLYIPEGGRISRSYIVRPSAIDQLGVNTGGAYYPEGAELSSRANRYAHSAADTATQFYSSGVVRRRIINPSMIERRFDATPGAELDSILRNARHPRYEAVNAVYRRNSPFNIGNHLSVASPGLDVLIKRADSSRVLARIDSGLTGSIPGVMPSMLIRKIRYGDVESVTLSELQQRYPQFFNQNFRRAG
ncbi:RHS repeat-associated core domain protein-containing protein [Pseudomonas sp. GM78]|uniref:RHS repeat-associated core domain-containing protein n=1 Tax=Pseudomonas sp. GM78 TaxID=1144337 RepID=UPI00026F8EAF|nr:RHS repeat-associated core domain-containing protein [Pseudomonas sp. GM78]EJN33817.1 RHS repeat-associated core domain protein-containing protein [Pseudomonas sp. GM78]